MTQIDVKDAVRLIWLAIEGKLTDEQIRGTLVDAEAKSHSEVAQGFGVSVATVRHTWRPNGMPSTGKRGVGSKAAWADVLIWLRKRIVTNAESKTVDEFSKRRREADTLAAEAEARLKQRKAEKEEGRFVSVEVIRSEWSSWLAMHRDDVMSIPDDIKPMFPAKDAERLKDELERRLAKAYEALAERPMDEFIESLNDNPTEQE